MKPLSCLDVKSLLGLASLFRTFVPQFPEYAAPSFKLLKRVKQLVCTDERKKRFSFEDYEILVHRKFDRRFIIHYDRKGDKVYVSSISRKRFKADNLWWKSTDQQLYASIDQ